MTAMFGGPKAQEPQTPRTIRMPTQDDPDVLAAAQRTRAAAMSRTGRLSTILTDQTKATTGGTGQKLGA